MNKPLNDHVLVYIGAIVLICIGVGEIYIGKALPISTSGEIITKLDSLIGFYMLSIGKLILGGIIILITRRNNKNK